MGEVPGASVEGAVHRAGKRARMERAKVSRFIALSPRVLEFHFSTPSGTAWGKIDRARKTSGGRRSMSIPGVAERLGGTGGHATPTRRTA